MKLTKGLQGIMVICLPMFVVFLAASAVWGEEDAAIERLRGGTGLKFPGLELFGGEGEAQGGSAAEGQAQESALPVEEAAEEAAVRVEDVSPMDGKDIAELDVVGNVSMTRAQVLANVRSRAGEEFRASAAGEDARRLAKLEGVQYAYYNVEAVDGGVKLTFVVVERNLIRSIIFSGNEKMKDSKLLKEISFRAGDYLDIFQVRAAVETFKEVYYNKGYAFVEIELGEEKIATGQVIYYITEGPRVKVAEVNFSGNTELKSSDLKKKVRTKTRRLLVLPAYYDQKKVKDDLESIRQEYQNRGYLDVMVKSDVEFSKGSNKAYVTFTINEGQQYITRNIVIEGSSFFSSDELLTETKLEPGTYYSMQMAEFDTKKILAKYLEAGFIYAKVEHRRAFPSQGRVDAIFDVTEGERYKIGYITITGNQMTHDKVVRRVLDEEDFVPGQWYNSDIARGDGQGKLEKDLRQTIYAESAFIRPSGEDKGVRNSLVNISEGRTGSVMFGAGVASDSGLVGQISFDQRNFDISDWPESLEEIFQNKAFKGAGQRLKISFEPGTEYTRFSINFTEPYLYDKPVAMDVIASSYIRGREAYDEERMKAMVAFEKRYRDDWRRGVAFRVENVNVGDVEFDAPKEIRDDKGDNLLFGGKLYLGKDTTDDRFLQTKGYNFNIGYEQVGGDHTFGVASLTQRWYKTLYEDFSGLKTVLETKVHGATIVGDAPVFEKFYAGGIGSIRGFEYRGVSTRGKNPLNPAVKEDPIGSDWILVGNAEVAVPLGSETFSALFFVDSGVIDTGGVRTSVGTGLQIMLPQWFGPVPMRFELATPLMKEEEDETRVFSFSAGALF